MSKLLTGAICLSDIPKEKAWKAKSGKLYLSVNVWLNDTPDTYGNSASIQVNQSQEERDAGAKKLYIGNLKYPQKSEPSVPAQETAAPTDFEFEDLPF